jgi:hypothetical protein
MSLLLLLQVASKEQRSIEKQLLNVTEKIKLQHFCQIMQFHNTLSNKQMAELYVSCWPFLPDSLAGERLLLEMLVNSSSRCVVQMVFWNQQGSAVCSAVHFIMVVGSCMHN